MEHFTFFTKESDINTRLDQFVYNQLDGFTHTQVKSFIAAGEVHVGFKKITDISHLMDKKQKVTVRIDPQKNYPKVQKRKKKRKIHVIYEDKDIIVVEKDSGVLSVPTRKREKDTVLYHINSYIRQKYNRKSSIVFIVHRLDQATSGILVFAKHQKAQLHLKKQFLKHSIERKYIAIVHGLFTKKAGKIRSFLKEDEAFKMKSSDTNEGKEAITHYHVLKEIVNRFSLVEAKLETGKRNQIRVHFSEMGHPIMGDAKYSEKKSVQYQMPRLALHAKELAFVHPRTNQVMKFRSEEPSLFKRFIQESETKSK